MQTQTVIRFSAWLFIADFFSNFPLTPDQGQSRLSYLYQLSYAVLSLALGVGLLRRRLWSYSLLWFLCTLVSVETILEMLSSSSQVSDIMAVLGGILPEVASFSADLVRTLSLLMGAVVLSGWWGLAFYLRAHRDYFGEQR
jgi:hypothetical protein